MPQRQQQQQQQQQQQPQRQCESGVNVYRISVVVVFAGLAAWAWQSCFGTSEGVVHKPDAVYDFIIVGGGTAGSVLAGRLSEEAGYKVLLIEAGGEEPWLAAIPLAAPLLQKSRFDWQHLTLPQKFSSLALKDKRSPWPRGRVLGGSGSINYNIHMYGSPQDYAIWEEEYGATGWGFEEMQKFANKAECRRLRPKIFKQEQCSSVLKPKQKGCSSSSHNQATNETEHIRQHQDTVQCCSPPLRTSTSSSTLTNTFLAAGKELGLPVGSLNDNIDHGVMAAATTIFKGTRWNTVRGYLRPALGRPNLHVVLYSFVTKVLWDGERAVGVEFIQWDNPWFYGTVYARGEVVLSTGALLTPPILMRSGVGPIAVLDKLKIPVVSERDGVGGNLQDHLNLPIYISLGKPVSLNPVKMRSITNLWQYFIQGGEGDLGRAAIEGVGAMRTDGQKGGRVGTGQPEVGLILFSMGAVDKHLYSSVSNMKLDYFDIMFPGMDDQSAEGFIFLASCLHPKSRGWVLLASADPHHGPDIDPNYLAHPYDRDCMRDAFKMAVHFARTKAFQKLGASVHLPRFQECGSGSEDTRSRYRDYVDCLVRVGAISGYHPLGTARMGKVDDPLAVVDPSLSVIGVERLRVVDASVMPTQISGTPNSVITVIAEKAAHMIKEKWGNGSGLAEEKLCSSSDCEAKLLATLSTAPQLSHPPPTILFNTILFASFFSLGFPFI